MGIITKEVEVRVNGRNIEYYQNLGYEIPKKVSSKDGKTLVADYSKTITVETKHLTKYSKIGVEVLCDFCKKEKKIIRYCDYLKSVEKYGEYYCIKCAHHKSKITSLHKYGETCYSKTEDSKNRRKQYFLEKFGVEDYFQTDEFKEKKRQYNLKHYGVDNYAKTKECHKKMESTMENLYGEKHALRIPKFKEKAVNTMIEHFGTINLLECPEIKEKIYKTNMAKYGFKNPMQSPEIKAKVNMSLCMNGTQKTSAQQIYLHLLYGGKLNYPVSYYAADICFPEEKFVIEYDGGGHDLRVVLKQLTQEEFNQKEIVRNNIIKKSGYKQMRIISSKDKLPSDEILLQMLEFTKKYFSDYPNHSWVEFDIDTSTVRNAERKDGVFFDYGELRKIKKSDVETTDGDIDCV